MSHPLDSESIVDSLNRTRRLRAKNKVPLKRSIKEGLKNASKLPDGYDIDVGLSTLIDAAFGSKGSQDTVEFGRQRLRAESDIGRGPDPYNVLGTRGNENQARKNRRRALTARYAELSRGE